MSTEEECPPEDRKELEAWRGLALALFQTLAETRADQISDGDRYAAEQSAQRASFERQLVQVREDFLGLVAHELKTPVAVIKAYAEVLEAQMAEPELSEATIHGEHREVVAHILDQAQFMSGLIEEILEVQRLQLGKVPLELSRLDLVQLARSAADEIEHTTHTHTIRVVADEGLQPVQADRRRIRQVVINLLENAVKYSSNGEIQVRLERGKHRGNPMALLSVHDEGIGLEQADVDRIFDRFVQTSGVPVRGHAGLGLGLYVARQIARAHGGDVWAESPGRGSGSTFHLRLPLEARLAIELPMLI